MKIRRERTHGAGRSNLDFNFKGEYEKADYYSSNLKYTDFGTMTRTGFNRADKATSFKEQVAVSGGWLNTRYKNSMFRNPRFETTSAFYVTKQNQNKPFQKQDINHGREGHLNSIRWSDKVFTGDTVNTTARVSYDVRKRDVEESHKRAKSHRQRTFDHKTVTDRLFPQKVIKENDPNTLEDKVDLGRVRDARRALRRRYAARNNIDAIFEKYDAGAKGFIDAHDLARQAKQIGLGISTDEAQVLIQSAKLEDQKDVKLNMEEYANLIFNQEDTLKVNLKELKPSHLLPAPETRDTIRSFNAPTEASMIPEPKSLHDDDYIILDQKKVPQNVIENIEKRLVRMNRRLQNKFGDASKMSALLNEQVKADVNGNISVDQLKTFVLNCCEEDLVDRRLSKKDIEGFLSAFNYNQYGATNIKGVSDLVFASNDEI